ncbi:MAG TPA: tRNA pseudouridine(55) synthase TruB [Longimicrobiales bacterium]|nr:tRNA pseudouridine(55) synthase TruB [Longimicrobiales bacterium]
MTQTSSFVLPVDKPVGPTSHDVVAAARRALKVRRIGHTGTLDPFASGLLLLCVGQATRIAEYLTDLPKTYRATMRLDGHTLTDDDTSEVVERSEHWRALSPDQVLQALHAQVGTIMQLPPQYSAKKIAGERAYDIARRGDVATLTPVAVQVHDITTRRIDLPNAEFDVTCSSGTYIRAIARDVGAALGTGGYLTALRRISIGAHAVADAVPLDELGAATRVAAAAMTPQQALAHMPAVDLTEEQTRAIRFGRPVEYGAHTEGLVQLLHAGTLIAIAKPEGGRLQPHKVFSDV